MRTLTKRQKKLLDTWFEENKKELQERGEMFFDFEQNDLFPSQLRQNLVQINDAECLYENINRYIGDKVAELLFGPK